MNKYTITDYEHFVTLGSGIMAEGVDLFRFNKLDESKGIIDDYLSIIDELYEVICNSEPILFNDDKMYSSYVISNYEMRQDCFIDNLTLVVGTKSSLNSNFRGEDVEILNGNYKVKNLKINIFIKCSDIKSYSGKEEFYSEMSHELQHAYRFYCILLSNNKNYKDEETIKMWRNKNASELMDIEKNTPQKIVSTLYYISDKNEISSETNRLYEFIRTHENINDMNYMYNENEFPLYSIKVNLEHGIRNIENNRKDKEFCIIIGNIYKGIIGCENITPFKAMMKFRTRLIYAYIFSVRNYYRTLAKAFEDFGRYNHINKGEILNKPLNWEFFEKNKHYEELRSILNKH